MLFISTWHDFFTTKMLNLKLHCFLFGLFIACCSLAWGGNPLYGSKLEGFQYPHEVKHFSFESQRTPLEMAYMDVPPTTTSNNQTVVLLHGKNFCAATWEPTIAALTSAGYRVIAPDQIGFCASTKPQHYQYSFEQLSLNTKQLLDTLGIKKAIIVGHSTGGMLGTRFALMYPNSVQHLVMINPIGLEDWKAKGVPYRTIDQWYERELKVNADGIRKYEQSVYYNGTWLPEYDHWVIMLAGLNQGPGHKLVAWNSALIYDMIFNQPVVYEFPMLKVPTTLIIGDQDITAIGSDIAPAEVKRNIGNYKELGPQACNLIPDCRLVTLPGLGHSPQIQAPSIFHETLLKALH